MHSYNLTTQSHIAHPFEQRYRDIFPMRTLGFLERIKDPDNAQYLGPVRNQNIPSYGECADESGAGYMDWLCRKYRQEPFVGSSLFLYQAVRTFMHDLTVDSGSRLRAVQYALQTVGTCDNSMDPDIHSDFITRITPQMLKSAAQHRIQQGYWAASFEEIVNALMAGHVVQIGVVLPQSFEHPLVSQTGIVPVPQANELILGGHAMLCHRVLWAQRRIRTRNSWGNYTPLGGDVDLPWEYFRDPWFLSARVYTF